MDKLQEGGKKRNWKKRIYKKKKEMEDRERREH